MAVKEKSSQRLLEEGKLDLQGMLLGMPLGNVSENFTLLHQFPGKGLIHGDNAQRGFVSGFLIEGSPAKGMPVARGHNHYLLKGLVNQKFVGVGRHPAGVQISGMGGNQGHQIPSGRADSGTAFKNPWI